MLCDQSGLYYNILVDTNVLSDLSLEHEIASLFTIIGQPTRLKILTTIGAEEVCVCHIEAALNMRQAVISQHLIQLKNKNLVISRKNARYQYYRLARPKLLTIISAAIAYLGVHEDQFQRLTPTVLEGCSCPMCARDHEDRKTCR